MSDVPTITDYLGNGGLFNPELMDHQLVGKLLIEIRDRLILARDTAGKGSLNGQETWHLTPEATAALKSLI